MKIAIVTCRLERRSSLASISLELEKYFSKKHDVELFANSAQKKFAKRHFTLINLPKIPFFDGFVFAFLSFFWLQKKKFDAVIATTHDCFNADVVRVPSCYLHGVKWLWSYDKKKLVDGFFFEQLRTTLFGMQALLSEFLIFKLGFFKKAVVHSNRTRTNLLKAYSLPKNKVELISHGVDMQKFEPNNVKKQAIRKKHEIKKDEKVLLFIGYSFLFKGLAYLLEALSKVKDKKTILLVLGDKHPKYELLAKKLEVAERVKFLGYKDNAEDYFAASDLFVFPSLYEPFGLVVLEAMASKVPVIVSNECGVVESLPKNCFIPIDKPWDSNEIASKIDWSLSHKKETKKIVENAYLVAKNRPWKKFFAEYEKVFENLSRKT